jgi:hypothetical protein
LRPRFALGVAMPFAALLWTGDTLAQVPRLPAVTLDDLDVQASFGTVGRGTQLGVALDRVLDAVFLGDRVAVLNNRPPWVRIYDAEGRLLNAAVGRGRGIGQTQRPFAISATAGGGLLLTHERGLEWLDADGALVRSLPLMDPALRMHEQPFQLLGAVEACGGDLVLQLENRRAVPPTVALVRARPSGELMDTLAVFPATRLESRIYHPWLVDAGPESLLTYTEEADVDRLLNVACDGGRATAIPVDPVGAGVSVTPMEGGSGFTVSPARGPYPAGLVRLGDRGVWATRIFQPREDGGRDSLTVIASLEEGRPQRQVALQGWFQLLDAAPNGSLLLGNSWPLNLNWEYGSSWGGPPAVVRIDGNGLLELIDRLGLSPPIL